MLEYQMFSIYDSKAEVFKQPFMLRTKGEAIRGFTDLANDEKTEIGKHPEDFTLFHLGSYDMVSGKFANLVTPLSLGVAIEFRRENNN